MFILRHLFFFVLQFGLAFVVTVGLCAGVTLYRFGWQYRDTPQFAEKLHNYIGFGIAAACLFCLVLLCYHLTRRSLEVRRDEPWNNTDNLG